MKSEFRSKAKGLLMGRDIRPRPMSVSKDEFDKSYERIFGKKPNLDEKLLARKVIGNTNYSDTLEGNWEQVLEEK